MGVANLMCDPPHANIRVTERIRQARNLRTKLVFKQRFAPSQFLPEVPWSDLVKLRMTVTVRTDLYSGSSRLANLVPTQHAAGSPASSIRPSIVYPSSRDKN